MNLSAQEWDVIKDRVHRDLGSQGKICRLFAEIWTKKSRFCVLHRGYCFVNDSTIEHRSFHRIVCFTYALLISGAAMSRKIAVLPHLHISNDLRTNYFYRCKLLYQCQHLIQEPVLIQVEGMNLCCMCSNEFICML
jgi:hypothetical protein